MFVLLTLFLPTSSQVTRSDEASCHAVSCPMETPQRMEDGLWSTAHEELKLANNHVSELEDPVGQFPDLQEL